MESEFLAAARLAWAFWLGDGEAVRQAQTDRKLRGRGASKVEGNLAAVAASLFAPPHEDARPVGDGFRRPWLDARLGEVARGIGVKPAPFWPEARPYAMVVTHDVDRVRRTYQGAARELRRGRILRAAGTLIGDVSARERGANAYDNWFRLADWEREQGYRSGWYFLNEGRRWSGLLRGRPQHAFGVYRLSDLGKTIRRLAARGHEIGIHYGLAAASDEGAIAGDRAGLAALSGVQAVGGRAHYLLFTHATRAGLARARLRYDASMAFNFTNGFRCGTAFPFPLCGTAGEEVWELPTALMDTALAAEAARWDERRDLALDLLRACRGAGGAFVVNWHQRFANPQAEPELWALMANLVARARADGAWFATPARLVKWWSEERLGGGDGRA